MLVLCIPIFEINVQAKTITKGQKLMLLVEQKEKENEKVNKSIKGTGKEKQVKKDYENVIEMVTKSNTNGNILYENYFGGIYLDNRGKLVVQITKDHKKEKNIIENLTSSNTVIVEVENSYKELSNTYKKISNQFTALVAEQKRNGIEDSGLNNLTDNMVGVSIDEKSNTTVVYLKNVTEEAKKQFREYYGKDDVIFEQGEIGKDDATLIKLGRAIYSSTGRGSVGMKAYYINSVERK